MARNEEAKKTLWQIAKFAIVGVLNTVVDFAVFQTLNLTLGWYMRRRYSAIPRA